MERKKKSFELIQTDLITKQCKQEHAKTDVFV